MVANNQQAALSRVLAHEGGGVDDPRDPGGRTFRGVTQRVYDAWRRGRNLPARDVFRAGMAEVRAIYMEQYWHRVRADELPAGLDYAIFDAAVNSGPVQAVKWLQRALGKIRVDGVVGQVTLGAVRAHPEISALIAAVCARRMLFLRQLRTWKHFGAGWTQRVAGVERAGQIMASGIRQPGQSSRTTVPTEREGAARADPQDIRVVRGAGIAQAVAGAGLATAAAAEALGGALQQAAGEFGMAAQQFPAFTALASLFTVVGACILVAGVGWRLYIGWRARMVSDAFDGRSSTDMGMTARRLWR